jgi:hypothetical protein
LLLRQAVERPKSPHQIHGMNPDHRASRKCLGDSIERDSIAPAE